MEGTTPTTQPEPTQVEKELAVRNAEVGKILGMRADQFVTERHVARARNRIRRREIKAKQSMDVKTMVAHFGERAEEGQKKGTTFRKEVA
jgi:sugar phosphate isomerase/epimerase